MIFSIYIGTCVVSAVTLLAPMIRAAPVIPDAWNSPCFALGGEGPITTVDLSNTTTDLITRTETILNIVNSSKQYMIDNYIRMPETVSYLELQGFLASDKTVVTDTKHQIALADPVSTLQEHYGLLSETAVYVHAALTDADGVIHTMTGYGDLKEHLRILEDQLYNTICSVKIGLLGLSADTPTSHPGYTVSSTFASFNTPYSYELYRAYIVLRDIERVEEYLLEVYDTMAEGL